MVKTRSDGQTLVAVALDQRLLDAIDKKRGNMNRSAFIREALVAQFNLPAHLAAAPDRTGKGGRPPKVSSFGFEEPSPAILNDAPNPEAVPSQGRVNYSNSNKRKKKSE